MRAISIARNYADTLFALAKEADALEAWGDLVNLTAAALGTPSIEAVMMSPRVTREKKIAILTKGLEGAPSKFVLFMTAVLRRSRQSLMPLIADEFNSLVDAKLGRVRAGFTTARPVDQAARADMVTRLSQAIGKEVIAGFTVDPALLGGTVVRIGDRIYDGSVRKRLGRLRRQLL